MIRVQVVVEGQTESAFLKNILNEYLGYDRILIQPIRIEGGGGNIKFERVCQDITKALLESPSGSNVVTSTAFDYYGIDSEWPGVKSIKTNIENGKKMSSLEIGDILRAETKKKIEEYLKKEKKENIDISNFIPYFQVHEFEALLFSDIDRLAFCMAANKGEKGSSPEKIVKKIEKKIQKLEPELINDKETTSPSKRIEQLFDDENQKYDKISRGIDIARQISVPKMREKCPNFNRWVEELEKLASS